MSFVNSPSPDFFHGLGNFENDGMAPAPNCHIYQEEEIPSENYSHEPSASNSDPNMSIANRSVLQDYNEENGDLRHGGFTCSGDTNIQETLTRSGNHDTLIHHASTMNITTMLLTQHGVTPATNSMNFQETSAMTSIANMSSPQVIHGGLGNFPPHESVPPETNHYIKEGYILVEGRLVPSGNMNFQGRELESSLMSSAGIGVNNLMPSGNMNFQGRELESSLMSISGIGVNNSMPSTSNPVPNMIPAKTSIASTSSHEAISEGQGNYSNQESEGLLNRNRMNDSMRSKGIKRSLEAREKGTEKQCDFQPSLEPKNKKLTLEELRERDGKQINKIMTDRLNRQIEQDKKSDMELVHAKQWPLKGDVQVIRQECKKIAKTCDLNTNEAKQKLLREAKNLEITQRAREDSGNPSTNMDHIVNHLDLYFDPQFIEAVMKKLSPDLGNGRSASSAFNDLKNQVYVQGNKQVEPEDFQGLPEELKKLCWGEIPSYIQPIASRIVKDFAKVEFSHTTALVLFCAAVKEMEDFPAEKLDLDTLKKWEATLKKAKEVGFQVGFADDLLRKNLLAFFAHTQILRGG